MALIINGEKIEDAEIKQEIEHLRPDYEKAMLDMDPKQREAQLLDWSKENVIERTLLIQEIKSRGPVIPEKYIEYVFARLKESYSKKPQELYKDIGIENDEKIKESIEMLLKTEQKFNELCKDLPNPTQVDIERYYEENKEQFKSADQVWVAQIVKYVNWQADEADAYNAIKQAQDELKNGAPFELVVDKYTDYPKKGGDLGYINRGKDAEEFEDVVFNLGVGEVSDIFRSRYGYHIAKVYDRKPGTITSLKEVKSQIVDELKEQMRQEIIDEFIDQLKSKAKIEEV
jgi:parvulin-like peptidyl-prolyl isomerase